MKYAPQADSESLQKALLRAIVGVDSLQHSQTLQGEVGHLDSVCVMESLLLFSIISNISGVSL